MENSFKKFQIIKKAKLGKGVKINGPFVNLYGCQIGDNTKIGAFVEIQTGAKIGKNCKISSHTFICKGVTLQDNVFVGHQVTFINDKYPRATKKGKLQTEKDWRIIPTIVKKGASIGTSATIMAGVTIGENALVGAGCLVTEDVPKKTIVYDKRIKIYKKLKK